jgi:hypothetical protein
MNEVISNSDAAQLLGIEKLNSLTQRRKRMLESGQLTEPDHTFKDSGNGGAILWTAEGLRVVAGELETDEAIAYLQDAEGLQQVAAVAPAIQSAAMDLDPAEVFTPDVLQRLDGIAQATLATLAPVMQQQYVQRKVQAGLPDAMAQVSPDLGNALGQWVAQSMGLNLMGEINAAIAPWLHLTADMGGSN